MKIITEGHKYSLANFENKGAKEQTIQFIEKVKGESDNLITLNDGTTNEEVLAVVVNRLQFLYYKFPSKETLNAIQNIEYAIEQLESRTKDRQKRKVEGKHLL